jgi:hypothetical protein
MILTPTYSNSLNMQTNKLESLFFCFLFLLSISLFLFLVFTLYLSFFS